MKIMIIAGDIGYTAPGIVFETLIEEISLYNDITLVTSQVRDPQKLLRVNDTIVLDDMKANPRVEKLSFMLFEYNISDYFWLHNIKKRLGGYCFNNIDVIISFISHHNYRSLLLGEVIANQYHKKWCIYAVDAIPAPIGWSKKDQVYKHTKKFISKKISKCDCFLSANKQMLQYQLKEMLSFHNPTGVLYTPIRKTVDIYINEQQANSPFFLYTGGLYGPRKKESLIDGFRLLLKDYPSAKMVFVGNNSITDFKTYEDLIVSGSLVIHQYSSDLTTFYKKATVLIDVNSYFENDVFLSSKIVNYLPIKKPILSVTGLNSPARNIFNDDPSIIHCSHNKLEIYNGLLKLISTDVNIEIRNKYIEQFSPSKIVRELMMSLNKINNLDLQTYLGQKVKLHP